jgi:hypothetical protein
MIKKIALGTFLVCSSIYASSIGVNINSDTLELEGEYSLNQSFTLNNNSDYFLTASYLNSEDNNRDTSDTLTTVGLKVLNPYLDDNGLSFGMGMKLVVADNTDGATDFLAAPLEIYGKFHFNEMMHIEGEIGYAPKVLTFLDGKSYKNTKIKANYQLIENGYVYLGGRIIETEYDNNVELDYDKSLFFGYKVQF